MQGLLDGWPQVTVDVHPLGTQGAEGGGRRGRRADAELQMQTLCWPPPPQLQSVPDCFVSSVHRPAAQSSGSNSTKVSKHTTMCRTQRDEIQVDQTGLNHLFGAAPAPCAAPCAAPPHQEPPMIESVLSTAVDHLVDAVSTRPQLLGRKQIFVHLVFRPTYRGACGGRRSCCCTSSS